MARSTVRSQQWFGAFLEVEMLKSVCRCGAKHLLESKVLKTGGFGALFEVRMWFCVAGTRDSAPCQK